jgi:hypothetical protein
MRELTTHTIELDFPSMSPHRVVRYEVTILGEDVNPPRGYVGPPQTEYTVVECRAVTYTLCWGSRDWTTPFRGAEAETWAPVLDTQPGGADEERVLMACNLI